MVISFHQGFQQKEEKVFRQKFCIFSHLVCSQKSDNFVFFSQKFAALCFAKERNFHQISNAKILRRKYGREIINYDVIKLLMLSYQSREFHIFFAQASFFVKLFFAKCCFGFANTNENFLIFSRKFSFAGNPSFHCIIIANEPHP